MNTTICNDSCAPKTASATYWKPRYETTTLENGYGLKVFLPGVDKTQVNISLEEDVLTVKAKRASTVPEAWKPLIRELPSGDYRLRLRLEVPVDPNGISAKLEDGVLEVTLPISEAAKPRVIAVA